MSGADSAQGPDWWQASDGKWYPPEQRPGAAMGMPPPGYGDPTYAGAPSPAGGPQEPGAAPLTAGSFFNRLFDMSFREFVTPSIIQVLFILALAVASVLALLMLIGGLATLDDGGIFLVILAPLFFVLNVIYSRVLLELFIVFFRIERNTRSGR